MLGNSFCGGEVDARSRFEECNRGSSDLEAKLFDAKTGKCLRSSMAKRIDADMCRAHRYTQVVETPCIGKVDHIIVLGPLDPFGSLRFLGGERWWSIRGWLRMIVRLRLRHRDVSQAFGMYSYLASACPMQC